MGLSSVFLNFIASDFELEKKEQLEQAFREIILLEGAPKEWRNQSVDQAADLFAEKGLQMAKALHDGARATIDQLAESASPEVSSVGVKLKTRLERKLRGEVLRFNPKLTSSEWELLLSVAAQAMSSDDLNFAEQVYMLLQIIRDDDPRPFIGSAITTWKRYGVNLAATLYELWQPAFEWSPAYLYYAADCYQTAGKQDQAREAILAAERLLEQPDLQEEVPVAFADKIHAARTQCCGC